MCERKLVRKTRWKGECDNRKVSDFMAGEMEHKVASLNQLQLNSRGEERGGEGRERKRDSGDNKAQ